MRSDEVWTFLAQSIRNFRPPPLREDLKEVHGSWFEVLNAK